MAEYIECRNCESPDCKGCNIKNLETMLKNGKFDCLMNENRCINQFADAAPVRHGRWIVTVYTTVSKRKGIISNKKFACSECAYSNGRKQSNYCPNCGADMRGINDE